MNVFEDAVARVERIGERAGIAGEIIERTEQFLRAYEYVDPERVAAFHVWRGRAADMAGRREDAVSDYRAALERPSDAPMKKAATRGLRTTYSPGRARRLNVDFTFADVLAP